MNSYLQGIWDSIQTDIRDKASPFADPSFVKIIDTASIMERQLMALDSIFNIAVPLPEGVEWVTAPGTPTFGSGTITETASEITVNGVNKAVVSATLSEPLAASGKHRLDMTAINYSAELPNPVYVLIQGSEVLTTESAASPALPANHLFVRQILVTESTANPQPGGAVKKISLNSESAKIADAAGLINLIITALNLPYIPTDMAWFDPILTGGETVVKEALDFIAAQVKANAEALAAKANKALAINTQTANYTLALSDAAGMVRMNVATANTVTIPPNSSVPFPIGTQIVLSQAGAGQTTIVPGSGVTVNASNGKLKLVAQYSGATLIKVGSDTWTAFGNLTA